MSWPCLSTACLCTDSAFFISLFSSELNTSMLACRCCLFPTHPSAMNIRQIKRLKPCLPVHNVHWFCLFLVFLFSSKPETALHCISHLSEIVWKEYWSNVRASLEPCLSVHWFCLLFPCFLQNSAHHCNALVIMYFPSICCSLQGILVKCQGFTWAPPACV